ncbi:MAG: hypothetical protein OHK0023_05800 [Anaerolineae bacterium]
MNRINLKVLVIDPDFYAQRALNSYMAWDRRTRVVALSDNFDHAYEALDELPHVEYPDVVFLDPDAPEDSAALERAIRRLRQLVPHVEIYCLAHTANVGRITAAYQSQARGYFMRNEVRLLLVNAVLFAREKSFVVTASLKQPIFQSALWYSAAVALPRPREYPEMTDRIRQALWLCVVEGMPAQLAADEMGISPHTIRSYVKEGYRILEAYDDQQYPEDMSPLERAFMRFTALSDDSDPQSDEA